MLLNASIENAASAIRTTTAMPVGAPAKYPIGNSVIANANGHKKLIFSNTRLRSAFLLSLIDSATKIMRPTVTTTRPSKTFSIGFS